MRSSSRFSFSSRVLWRRLGYGLLLVVFSWSVILGTGFSRTAFAASAVIQPQQVEKGERESGTQSSSGAETSLAMPSKNSGQAVRSSLNGTPLTFTNASVITINAVGKANPYPSAINVDGVTGNVIGVTVHLYGVTHSYSPDLDILLVGPTGQKTILMSDRGSSSTITSLNLTFDDTASIAMSIDPLYSGSYRPSDNDTNTPMDPFESPAPSGPYPLTLSVFNYVNPNGTWQLFVLDDANIGAGQIAGGWAVTLYTTDQSSIVFTSGNNQSATVATSFSNQLQATVRDASGMPVSGTLVTFTAPASGAGGTFAGGTTIYTGTTNAQGFVSSSVFTANTVAGSYNVTATNSLVSFPLLFKLTNTPGTASSISINGGNGQQMSTGGIFSQPLSVVVRDAYNNLVSNVSVDFSAPASGASGTFANNQVNSTATTDITGVAKSTAFTPNNTLGTYQVVAKISSGASVSFTLTNLSPGTVELANNSYSVSEGVGSVAITLNRSGTSAGAVVANLKVSDLTTNASDYAGNNSSQLDTSFNPGTGTPGETSRVVALPDGKILLSGNFASYNGQSVGRIARLNANGSLDTTFLSTGAGTNATVNDFVVQPDGKIIIVGTNFSTYNGTTRNRIARLNADGSLDTTFAATGAGANGAVLRVALQLDGKVLIGGDFTSYDGVVRYRIARLNTDGTLDTTFGFNLSGANNTVWTFALQADGKIIIGGSFTSYNGTTANRIARLNADGTLDTTFNTNLGFNNVVWSILVPDAASGKILVGGEFTSYNNQSANYIVRLNGADGSRDTSFDALNSGANESIRTMALQPDGKVLLGGTFSNFNNVLANRIARLNTDGSFDLTVLSATSNGGPNNLIWTIAAQPDGKILVGGDLTTYDGVSRNHIARVGGYSVAWASGDSTPKTFALPIVDDNLIEGSEQLTVTIDSVRSTATLGSNTSVTVTILDNEGALLAVVSGSGQSAAAGTGFGQPLVVNLLNASFAPIAGQIVTFTAPATGVSALFANGSNIYTVTTNANGIAMSGVFTANLQPGTYNITATSGGVAAPVSFALTNSCSGVAGVVTSLSDNGKGTACGTLSYALLNASSGVTVTFSLGQGSTITLTDSLTVSLKAGVGINGGANGIVINGGGVNGDGLVLSGGNVLTNLTVRNFGGREIVAPASAPGNKFYRVKLES